MFSISLFNKLQEDLILQLLGCRLTQSNHIFMALYAAARLECLSIRKNLNTFALKQKLYLKATRQAYEELQALKRICA